MTQKELIQKLIEHYQFGIDNLPMEEWDYFLHKENLWAGICWCAFEKFGIDIEDNCNWMQNILKGENYICPKPYNNSREKALEYLQIRLDALKSIDLNTLEL